MERLIPITKKQHDAVVQLSNAIAANQQQLTTFASAILMGGAEEIGEVGIVGARCTDGVYTLVIEVPDVPETVKDDAGAAVVE